MRLFFSLFLSFDGLWSYNEDMTEFLKNALFPIIARKDILVFPTEESARSVSVEYVLEKKVGIFKDRCISFDTFAEKFYDTEGRKAVSDFDRIIFSNAFVENNYESLRYIYSQEYPEMKSFLPSFIKGMLGDLDETAEHNLSNADLLEDLRLIKREYRKFLAKNKLYDISYIKPMLPDAFNDDCYLVTPEIYPKEAKLLKREDASKRLRRISIESIKAPLHVFDEEKAEIRNLFLEIRKLTDSNVGMENIAISAAGFDRIKPFLKQEAMLFDIPLVFAKGDSLLSSVPGMFLNRLKRLYDDKFRIEDMKAFFLEPSFEFVERREIRDFISQAVQLSIVSSIDGNEDRFMKISSPDAFNYYKFKAALERLMNEKNPSKVASSLAFLVDFLLGSDCFKSNETDNKCYGMIQSHLSVFLESARNAQENGYSLDAPLFSLFLKALEGISYVDSSTKEGVKVYPFSQSASIPYAHHFLICLNEKESSKTIRDGEFLSEYERAGLDDGVRITEGLISSYIAFNENVYLSCSRNTSTGAELPLAYLSENEVPGVLDKDDSWRAEASNDRKGNIFRLQKEGYEKAKNASLKKLPSEERFVSAKESNPKLSFTSVSEYEKCPFSYSLQYEYGLKNLPSYDISKTDRRELGTRLHSVMERFFRFDGHNPAINLEKYFNQEMEAWKNGMEYSFDRESGEELLRKMPRGSASASDTFIQYIRHKFFDNLVHMAELIVSESEPYEDGIEMRLSADFEENGFSLKGFADKVGVDSSTGNLIIYDYKSGKKYTAKELEDKRLQFFIYRFILEKLGESVDKGKFLFLKYNKFCEVLENTNIDDDSREFKRLIDAASGIKSGQRSLTDDFDECAGCSFKAICRRNMVVR